MNQKSLDFLYKKLSESGYKGTSRDLMDAITASEQITKLEDFSQYMNSRQKNSCDEDKKHEIDELLSFVDKLILRFDSDINVDFAFGARLYFSSRKNAVNNKSFSIIIEVKDGTNRGSMGYYGSFEARILYGYGDRKKEHFIVFKEKEPY